MTGDEFPFDGPRLLSLRTQDWPEADRVLALARDRPDEAMARKRLPSDVGFQANQAEAAYVALWPAHAFLRNLAASNCRTNTIQAQ